MAFTLPKRIGLIKYSLLSDNSKKIILPAEAYFYITDYLTGCSHNSDDTLKDPRIKRFKQEIEAIRGDDYENRARQDGLDKIVDYIVLKSCELFIRPLLSKEEGSELKALFDIYGKITDCTEKLEHLSVTQGLKRVFRRKGF